MLYNYLKKAYIELFKVNELPIVLKFRLNNIAARKLNYEEFIYHFNLKNEYEALDYILDDRNMEDIMRYSIEKTEGKSINYYPKGNRKNVGYDEESTKAHITIDKSMKEQEQEYKKRK